MLKGKSFHHLTLAVTALFFFLSSLNFPFRPETIASSVAVFMGTLFIYRLSTWVPVISSRPPFLNYINPPDKLTFSLFLLLCGIPCFYLSSDIIIKLILWAALSISYFTNVNFNKYHFRGLRSIPVVKTVLLAFMWTIIGFLFKLQQLLIDDNIQAAFVIRFLLIFIICLGVDLRDIEKDKEAHTTTIATLLGFQSLKIALLILTSIIVIYEIIIGSFTVDLLISTLLLIILSRLKINSSTRSFTILMDGTLMLYSFLVLMIQLTCF